MKHVKNCVPSQSLIMLYKTLVEPYFRYCSTTWGKCGKTLQDKLQMLQNKAARTVRGVKFEETDHNQLLRSLEWLSTRQLVDYNIASFMYKVANGIVPEKTQFMFNKCTNVHSHNIRSASSGNYVIPKMKTAKGKIAFVFSGAQVCNNLLTHIKAGSVNSHIPRQIKRISHSTKYMMTIKIETLYIQGFFDSFSICLAYFHF